MAMLRFFVAILPVSSALEGYQVGTQVDTQADDALDSGISLLQLSASPHKHNATHNAPRVYRGETPGPNPIVTQEQCRQKAMELGYPMGGSADRPGTFLVVNGKGAGEGCKGGCHYQNMFGCIVYRYCARGSSSFPWLYHVFYLTRDGSDATLEEVSMKVKTQAVSYLDELTVDNGPETLDETRNGGCPWKPLPQPVANSDEGEAVGDPHITYAGHHHDVEQSDVHH